MRTRLTALAGAAACTALIVPGLAATPAQAATKVETIDASLTRVNLLNINDFHGRIDGGSVDGVLGKQLACTVETSKATLGNDSTVLLSAGDNIGASTFASFIAQDEPTIKYLNALQLKASAVGNHEFDQGFGDLTGRVTKLAQFPYLGANVYEKGTQTPALPEYKIVTVNGVRVGVIGAVTKSVPELVSPSGISGLDFGDPVAAVNRVAEKLRKGGLADVIVAEYHEGAAPSDVTGTLDAATASNSIFDSIVNDTSDDVDVVFNAHTHALYLYDGSAQGGTRAVMQTQSYGAYVGQIQLGIDPTTKKVKQYSATNVPTKTMTDPDATCASDPEYKAAASVVNDAIANAKVLGAQVIGHVAGDVTRAYSGGTWSPTYTGGKADDRQRESTLSNLEAQAWVDSLNVPGRSGADIGIQNPGGVRSDLTYTPSGAEKAGEVTYSEAAAINPFANTLVTVSITGAQLKTLLEQQWQPAGSSRAFLSLGLSKNVTYTFDESRPAGDRITGVFVDGKPVASDATFKVATNSFLAGGGDNFTVLAQGAGHTDSGLIDMDAFITWLKNHGTVTPDFTTHGVEVTGVPASIKAGDQVTFTVSGWDLTSLGSPRNTSATLTLNGVEVPVTIDPTAVAGTPALDGVAKVTFTVTDAMVAGLSGSQVAMLTSGQTPTKVSVVLNVIGSATPSPTATPTVSPTVTPTPTVSPTETPQPTDTPTAVPTVPAPTGTPTAPPTAEPTVPAPTHPGKPEHPGKPGLPGHSDKPGRGVPAYTGDN